ncbi:MaoC family dehydratase [Aliihoeflea sp. 2WW]|uniref:MaoC family dehydratase n=1 Tax=Aliihoeflea sp. 2WW TaxID=1381123 RepID=UPI001377DD58|nr:MaoC family dehydratase [Aliihoeflea sp. 2WW]
MFTDESIREIATLTGDFNPIHHDTDFARQSRFGGLIASGGHVTGYMMGVASRFLTSRGAGLGIQMAFTLRRATPANVPLTIEWTIRRVEPQQRAGRHLVELEGELSQDGIRLVTGSVTCLVSREPFY